MLNIYTMTAGIFDDSMEEIKQAIYSSSNAVFGNGFFELAYGIALIWIGGMIAFRKIQTDEIAHKFIWTLIMFGVVKLILFNEIYYHHLVDILNIPRDVFLKSMQELSKTINKNATTENIINTLYLAITQLSDNMFKQGGLTNLAPYIYGGIVFITGMILILVTILNTIFSIFLSDITMALLPLVIVTLIWKKTEYVFFAWVKLYISISLYAPFTILFGIISIKVVDLTMSLSTAITKDINASVEYIIVLVLAQALIILGIFKIPNIINQLIGSSNEGSSLTSGIGTISAGGAIMSAISKYTGMSATGKVAGKGLKAGGKVLGKNIAEKIQMR